MTESKRYKLYKHNKQWVVGCSAILLSLAFEGVVNAQAATDTEPETITLQQPVASAANAQAQQSSAEQDSQETAPASVGESNLPNSSADQPAQSEANKSTPASAAAQAEPATAPAEQPRAYSAAPQEQYGVRHIRIQYYDRYTNSGVEDSAGVAHPIYVHIDQQAVNGKWEAINWTPPEGTFEDGIPALPIHIAAQDAERDDCKLYASYVVRVAKIPTTTGVKYVSDTHVIVTGYPYSQEIHLPDIAITSDIPAPYHPYIKYPNMDNVISRGGNYYVSGATIHVAPNADTYTYEGIVDTRPNVFHLLYNIRYESPVSVEFDDLNGNPYQAQGFFPARYSNIQNIDYGQTLSNDRISQLATRYWNAYMQYAGMQPGTILKGYFSPDGTFHEGMPSFNDASTVNNSLKFRFVVVHHAYMPVDGTKVTKTRKIILHKPSGDETVTQTVTFQQFKYRDDITGRDIPGDTDNTPVWRVLTDPSNDSWSDMSDNNHSWAAYTVPTISGYVPSQTSVSAQSVNPADNDVTVDIYYNHGTSTDEESKTVTRTINVTTPDGHTHTVKQRATLYRQVTRDAVTNAVISYGPWSTSSWGEYTPAVIPGYTPSLSPVP